MKAEIRPTLDEEARRDKVILIPFMIDDFVMDCDQEWAVALRNRRNFGDFCEWKDHDRCKTCFERLLKELEFTREN